MRRFNILFAFAFILLTSCFTDEVDYVGYQPSSKGGIHIVGAVEEYDVKSVGTRADDDGIADSYISEMTMFIFKSNGDLIQGYTDVNYTTECTSAINIQRGNPTFLIDTEEGILADLSGGSDTDIVYYNNDADDLGACDIYIVANAWHQLSAGTVGSRPVDTIKDLDALKAFVYQADATLAMPTIEDGSKVYGFPMIGKQQGGSFKLKKGDDNEGNAVATIPLKKLYSKVRFTMQINADQVVAGQTPKFTISKVEVFNVPKMARLGRDYDKDYLEEIANTKSTSTPSDYYYCTNTADPTANPEDAPFVIDQFNKKTIYHSTSSTTDDIIEFGFYMPEHKVTPNPIQLPSTMTPEEKEKYAQYYKPTGVGAVHNGDGTTSAAKIATFVRIHGSYTDHNGQILGVTYDIYLGQNNSDDFTIKRNQLLNNKLIITGLTNHKDAYGDVEGNISIDHRVEVSDRGFNLSMERTAILDAHFEVRPLDIELSPNSQMVITIPEEYRSWIAMENDAAARSGVNPGLYVNTATERKGVRKYFTTNLVSELNTANEGTITLSNNDANTTKTFRIWFYVDENPNVYDKTYTLETSNTTNGYTVSKEQYRVCPVQFTYQGTKKEGEQTVAVTKTEKINFQQWNLWRVWSADGKRYYDIEHEEEYLNNYASDMQYGQTQNGMPWGLEGIQLSHTHDAAYFNYSAQGIIQVILSLIGWNYEDLVNEAFKGKDIKYDFYLPRDVENNSQLKDNVYAEDHNGRVFYSEIVKTLLKTSGNANIKMNGVLLNDNDLKSAVAYCYNKNKRGTSGNVCTVQDTTLVNRGNLKWYLPAIDEMEDIARGAYDQFDGVFQKNYYWSCQPSYNPVYVSYDVWRWGLQDWQFKWYDTGNNADGYYYIDNPNRARATSVEVENGVFKDVTNSGSDVYMNQTGDLRVMTDAEFIDDTPNYLNPSYDKYPGNKKRTESCRIRAVYRSGKVN